AMKMTDYARPFGIQGSRYVPTASLLASGSPMTCSFALSQRSFRPTRQAIFPSRHTVFASRPIADIEDGHYANTVCRLGNIACRVGRKLRWDNAKEQVIGDPEANKLAVGTYRDPWIPKGLA